MLRPVALWLLCVAPAPALALETVRIAIAEGPNRMEVRGEGLSFGADTDEGPFVPVPEGFARVALKSGRLELNGVPVVGEAIRFRSVPTPTDAGFLGTGVLRADGTDVRGDVVVRRKEDALQLINVIGLEDYLAAVLGSEMPVSFPPEALKAQAVAARTYALQKKLAAYGSPYHLGSTVLHQVYAGLHREDPRTRSAVEATRGEVLTFELAPIEAYFHASCGGRTEAGIAALQRDLPYLQPVSCPCGRLPRTRWKARLSDDELEAALRAPPKGLRVAARSDTGRASRVALDSGRWLDAAILRRRLGYTRLKSLSFDVERDGAGYQFSGRGYGHGAGLCQWGAQAMARRGASYREILFHYYPGVELQRLY